MIKSLTIFALVLAGMLATGGISQAAGRGCRGSYTPYVAQSAAAADGTRTYSYEPGMAGGTSGTQSYYYSRPDRPFTGFHSAGWKITGR